MESALQKVDVSLSERYHTTCENCKYERQFFGTKDEARQSAVTMGWEFRKIKEPNWQAFDLPVMEASTEVAYCPHCKLLVP